MTVSKPGVSEDRPHFNTATILEFVGDDREFLEQLVTLFHQESARLGGELQAGLALGNARDVERSAHSLKGMLSYFGPSMALELASEIESHAAEADLDSSRALAAQLGVEFDLIRVELDRL